MNHEVVDVAVEAGKRVLAHAAGPPARIVAVGVAAGLAAVSVGIGYGIYRSGALLLQWMNKTD
jgi:hypothetical protein